ncbi:uncharacterized protein TNCV_2870901 [Trichonephila clavipes]|nr:uncharacterized protein TNCV_2870901 [Trichonephila clavipes]
MTGTAPELETPSPNYHTTPTGDKVYFAYFDTKLGDQDKSWAPHLVWSVCVEELRQWFQGFLGNKNDPNYKALVAELLQKYKILGCNMSVKVHFLHSHLDYFPENLGAVNEEQGERFHQDIKEMERRYQGRWNVNMMADYCWMLKRDFHNNTAEKALKEASMGK